jgi:hypothetical protein
VPGGHSRYDLVGDIEVRVLCQHRCLEPSKFRPGFETELLAENSTGLLELAQSVGLATRPVGRA